MGRRGAAFWAAHAAYAPGDVGRADKERRWYPSKTAARWG